MAGKTATKATKATKAKPGTRGRGRQARAGEPMEEMLRVRFTTQEWADLGRFADRKGISRSEVVRDALVTIKAIRYIESEY